jgi:gamma-glutamyl phosphate reductase
MRVENGVMYLATVTDIPRAIEVVKRYTTDHAVVDEEHKQISYFIDATRASWLVSALKEADLLVGKTSRRE